MSADFDWDELIAHGLGRLTRSFGTAPGDPALGAQALARAQRRIAAAGRFGIPAVAHEECLDGFTAWRATAYPVPLAWGAAFDPARVAEMGRRIGQDLRACGVHQGLAPVLDVVRDPRWGRVEETIGEDPYLVGTIGTAYVRGLESAGVVATLKHFAGYASSAGARDLAPVRAAVREFADITLPPFEISARPGGERDPARRTADRVPAGGAAAGRVPPADLPLPCRPVLVHGPHGGTGGGAGRAGAAAGRVEHGRTAPGAAAADGAGPGGRARPATSLRCGGAAGN